MANNEIIEKLIATAKPFLLTTRFSKKPGIYALFFIRKDFPIADFEFGKNTIIYIGKTESSQISRDLNTHFESGKTGSSTLRRSIGALLREKLQLKPIPRNDKDFGDGRLTMFQFDQDSEEKLTLWMKENLGLSFYEFDRPPAEIDALESLLIGLVKPVFNIDAKNLSNPLAPYIKESRKATALEGFRNGEILKDRFTFDSEPVTSNTKRTKPPFKLNLSGSNVNKYTDLWDGILPTIMECFSRLSEGGKMFPIPENLFQKVGNRKSYSFNLVFENGIEANNIKGSAVARDLAWVIRNNGKAMNYLKGKTIKIRMDSQFNLHIQQI